MARIQGTNQNDRLFGTRGDDLIEGLDGDDLISAGSGKNTIYGGAGNDRIVGGRDDDEIDGGSGDDHVWGRNGDDVLTYNLSENIGSTDYYDGGYHNDTLRLVLNREQYETPGILQDIAQFEQFLANNANPNTAGGPVFQFTAFNLTVRNIEQLEIVIVDPPEVPTLSIDDPTVTEGDPGDNTSIAFTVMRSGDNGAASTVNYSVTPGSATFPADYNDSIDPLTGSLNFAAGETSKTITLDVTDDEIPEGTESFTVELSGATNASIVKGTGTGTILDDDLPTLLIDDPTVTEGDPGDNTSITFTVMRSGDNGAASTVNYSVMPGSASFPADYNDSIDPLTGSLSFAANETSKTITLDVTDDEIPEGTESFTVELSGATNASIVKGTGTGTILDDDLPTLLIDDPTVTEGDPGDNTSITFTVMRSGDNGAASTVNYSVMPGSASFPADYNDSIDPLTGSLSFAANETSKTITLDVTDDEIPEGTESFTVELSGATNASIVKGTGTGTILDDDLLPGFSIDNPTVTEGDPAGPDATITFTVTRSGDSSAESTVDYTAIPGSALFPDDYNDSLDPLTGTLTFAAGEISKSIKFDITDDLISEETETFTVVLSNPSNATIVQGTGTGTILDDEALRCGNTWGDPHYVTFDGLKYDYQGVGEYWLVQSTGAGGFDDLNIQTRTVAFRSGVSVNSAVAAEIGEDVLCINTWPTASTAGIEVRINGELVTDTSPITLDGGIFSFTGNQYQVEYTNGERLLVTDYGSHMTIRVCLLDDREGTDSIRGFLGDFDGDPSNDIALPNGSAFSTNISFTDLYGSYGESWRITQDESLFCYGPGETTETFTNRAFPRFAATLDIFPQDQIDAARALITATCDITDPALLDAAVLDYLISGDLSYIEAACTVEDPVDAAKIIDPKIIWQNDGQVIIGTAAAPANFNIGTNAAAPAGIVWTGFTVSDDWSQPGNWTPVGAPTPTDVVVFNGTDAGAGNVVDQNFEVAGLYYTAAGDYVTDLNGGSVLQVNGAATIDVVGPMNRVTLIVKDGTEVVHNGSEVNIGINGTGTSLFFGNLVLSSGVVFDGTSTEKFSVGRSTNVSYRGQSDGSLTLGTDTTLDVGTAAAPATLNIGWNESTIDSGYSSYVNTSNASGVLDATEGVLTAQLSELNVGLTATRGTASGHFAMGDGTAITVNTVNVGMGGTPQGGAIGTFEVNGGTLAFTGTDSSFNFGSGGLMIADGVDFGLGTVADRLTHLRIGYNTSGIDLADTAIDLTGRGFTAYIADELSIGRSTNVSYRGQSDGSLTLGTDTTLDVGTAAAPATLNIGWNESTIDSGYSSYVNTSNASGVLDATEGVLTAQLSELNVGLTATRGTASGHFAMGDGTAITVNTVNVGMGGTPQGGAIGTFEVNGGTLAFTGTDSSFNFGSGGLMIADGVDFGLGTVADRLTHLRIGYNTSGIDLADTAIDLTGRGFTAYIADELSIGRSTNVSYRGQSDGSLTLGTDTTLDVGTAAAPATLNIGWNESTIDSGYSSYVNTSNASGVLDATEGVLTAQLSELNVGLTATRGTASGHFAMGDGTAITVNTVNVGMGGTPQGGAIGTFEVNGGTLAFTGTDSSFNFGSGGLMIADGVDFGLGTVADRLTHLRIGYNTSGIDLADTAIDLTGRGFTAYIADELSIGRSTNVSYRGQSDGSLTLGTDTTLDVGTAAAPATLNIGWNESTIDSGYSSYVNTSNASGVLDATEGVLTAQLSELNVGLTATRGTASGHFAMGDGTAITVNTVNVGMGGTPQGGAIGTFEVNGGTLAFTGTDSSFNFGSGGLMIADGVDFGLGTVADRLTHLRIGYNTSGIDLADTAIDLTGRGFTAYIADELSIGRSTNVSYRGQSDGSLTLGTDTTLDVGTAAAPATLNIGWNESTIDSGYSSYVNTSNASGVLDATEGVLTAQLSELNVGLTATRGTASGHFAMGDGTAITVNTVNVGMGGTPQGGAIGTFEVNGGTLAFTGTDSSFNFGSGGLMIADGVDFGLGTVADRLTHLRIGYNTSGIDLADTAIDLTGRGFTAYIADELSIGRSTNVSYRGQSDGSLTLGTDTTLDVGTAAAPATLNIGWNESTIDSGYSSYVNTSNASGVLDATEGVLTAQLSELNVGLTATRGTASGHFAMGDGTAITVNTVNVGMGGTPQGGAIGTFEVNGGTLAFTGTDSSFNFGSGGLMIADGVDFGLGTVADRLTHLRIGYNTSGIDLADTAIDLTGRGFTAYIADELSIGRSTNVSYRGQSDGSLTLGTDTTLDVGTAAAPATLNIGWNESTIDSGYSSYVNTSNASGVLDATEGVLTAQLSELNVGLTATRGTASGHFAMGDGTAITVNTVNVGMGGTPQGGAIGTISFIDNFTGNFQAETIKLNRGLFDFGNNTLTIDTTGNIQTTTFNLTGGMLQGGTIDYDDTTGTFNFSGGTLAVDTFNGTLNQTGGTMAPGNSPGVTTVNGNYNLSSAGAIQIELNGSAAAGVDFDQLNVNGVVNLNADVGTGGELNLLLGFTPTIGNSFTIIDNDASDLIIGFFEGLGQLANFDVINGNDHVTFQIDYAGGDGNDVVLTATNVMTAVPLVATRLAVQSNDASLTGAAGDEPLVFGTGAASAGNLSMNPETPLELMIKGVMDAGAVAVDDSGAQVNLDEGAVSDFVPDLDDAPLIGLSSDMFDYHDSLV